MRTINDVLEGPQILTGHVRLLGMITGDVVVASGAELQLHGMCCANLRIEANASVALHGTVSGDVTNAGGDVCVFGIIAGRLIDEGGSTVVHPGAIVTGTQR